MQIYMHSFSIARCFPMPFGLNFSPYVNFWGWSFRFQASKNNRSQWIPKRPCITFVCSTDCFKELWSTEHASVRGQEEIHLSPLNLASTLHLLIHDRCARACAAMMLDLWHGVCLKYSFYFWSWVCNLDQCMAWGAAPFRGWQSSGLGQGQADGDLLVGFYCWWKHTIELQPEQVQWLQWEWELQQQQPWAWRKETGLG